MADVGLRVNETCKLDLPDIKWDLGRFGKLHVRLGKGARGSGPRERMVSLINNAGGTLRWFVEDVWGHFGDDHTRPGVPLLLSERKNADGTAARVGDETIRSALAGAAAAHLPDWPDVVTPHVLRHFCASQLYAYGMDLIAIQEILGHAWIAASASLRALVRHKLTERWSPQQVSRFLARTYPEDPAMRVCVRRPSTVPCSPGCSAARPACCAPAGPTADGNAAASPTPARSRTWS